MKALFNFLEDEAFNALKVKMGANSVGDFHSFDPRFQLTFYERQQLAGNGIELPCDHLRPLKDKTIALKNSRVWLLFSDQLHVASCPHVQTLRRLHKVALLGTGDLSNCSHVCSECLNELNYLGMDARRSRRMADQLDELFSIEDFKQKFPFYPV